MVKHKRNLLIIGLVVICILSSGLVAAQDTCGTDSGEGCAPESERVDFAAPVFSNPTSITNPLFPISSLNRVLLFGTIDGLSFRTETTLLSYTRTIEWNGQQVETLVSQYVAFLDGRIEEVALDWYAQADDGSVWYLGEDVFNYEEGVVADNDGTWLAGRDGPGAMIMPGNPQVGDVYRPENIPGVVFEEVRVVAVGETMHGPQGMVEGAIIVEELHQDGTYEDKIFAPGYGEFLTGTGGDLEAVALAIPVDVLGEPMPAEVETLFSGAMSIYNAAHAEDWQTASATLDTMLAAWAVYQSSGTPRMLAAQMGWALVELVGAVDASQPIEARQAAIDVARASLDFQLRYREVVEVDFALFDLWAAQILVDVAADDSAAVMGDVATLEWFWDRIKQTLDTANVSLIEAQLVSLRTAADGEDLAAAASAADQLRALLAGL